MSYESALNLRNAVTRTRTTTGNDGMGGTTTSTVTVTLGKAALWQVGSNDTFLSDQIKAISSHVLACRAADDIVATDTVTYSGVTYKVSGRPEDVMQRGIVQIVPLQRVG